METITTTLLYLAQLNEIIMHIHGFLIGICILLTFGFPLTVYLEFRKDWAFNLKLCPHITLFPILFYWAILIVFYKMFYVSGDDWIFAIKLLLPLTAITYMALKVDLISDQYLLLLELKQKAFIKLNRYSIAEEMAEKHSVLLKQMIKHRGGESYGEDAIYELVEEEINNISELKFVNVDKIVLDNNRVEEVTFSKSDIKNCIKILLKSESNRNIETIQINEKLRYKLWARILLSYSIWKNSPESFSLSRIFYGLAFFLLVIALLFAVLLMIYSWFIDKNEYRIPYLIGIGLLYTCWLPLRTYYNQRVKSSLFLLTSKRDHLKSENEATEKNNKTNILERILGKSNSRLVLNRLENLVIGRSDQYIYVLYSMFILFLAFQSGAFNQNIIVLLIYLLTIFLAILSSLNLQIVDVTLGLKSNSKTWIFWIPLIGLILTISKVIPISSVSY